MLNRMGPSSAGRHRTNTSSTTTEGGHPSRSSPMSGISQQPAQDAPAGGLGAPAPSLLPGNRPAPRRWTSSLGRPGASAAPQPVRMRNGAQVWRRPSCEPRTANVRPSLPRQARFGQRRPSRSRTTATRPTRSANRGRSRRTDAFYDPARCGQRGCSGGGHRTSVCPDSRISQVVWTLVAWTPDVRPTSWTDVRPHGGQRTRPGDERRGRRPDIRTATTTAIAG